MNVSATAIPQKKVSILLIIGIFLCPIIFVWFLLSKGYSERARAFGLGWLIAFLLIAFLRDKPASTDSNQAGSSQVAATSKPVNNLPQDTLAVQQIEQRIKDNKESLKKFYSTSDSVTQVTTDIIQLTMIKSENSKSDSSAENKALGKRAGKLLPQLEQQSRTMYASSLENSFMKNGLDFKVSATGKELKQLRLVYALMSKPLVYKFQNDMKIDSQATMMGFSKLVFTNGFESDLGETWTIDLKS
jgi:hypothetical protein